MIKIITSIVLLSTSLLLAKDYALIVGISKYKNLSPLSHINSDITTYKKILKKKGVHSYINTLENESATKYNILSYLKNTLEDMKKRGDKNNRFFMFFAGHGENIYKLKNKIPQKYLNNSGVILPFEYDKNRLSDTIIIGSRDLRGLLIEIDKYLKESLVIFDACYAQNSIRDSKTPFVIDNIKGYPYKNIVYISASTTKNKAKSGVLSKVLNRCLDTISNLKKLKECMNRELTQTGQTTAIFSK